MEMISSGLAGMEVFSTEFKADRMSICGKAKALRRENRFLRDEFRMIPRPPPTSYEYPEDDEEEEEEDDEVEEVARYRGTWERCFGRSFGSFDDETTLEPMRHTHGPIPDDALPDGNLQIFSIRIKDLKGGLRWPLQVYGLVATRDPADHKRNFLFKRPRDNCQTLIKKNSFLLLTGPSRAVMLVDPVTFEVQLKVKGKSESEDEVLAFKIFKVHEGYHLEDGIRACIPHNRCTLEFALAVLPESVEATVSVQLVQGSWLDQYEGLIVCHTNSIIEGEMELLDFPDGKLPIRSDGVIELSRRVVSVEYPRGKLTVSVVASQDGYSAEANAVFKLKESETSVGMCDLGFCKMKVTIYWSLLSEV